MPMRPPLDWTHQKIACFFLPMRRLLLPSLSAVCWEESRMAEFQGRRTQRGDGGSCFLHKVSNIKLLTGKLKAEVKVM